MPKSIFVSYCHRQGEWVLDRLVPCLRAAGVEVVIDRERFVAGRAVSNQMDRAQDDAEATLLALSPDYLASPFCRPEMERALARDPGFRAGSVVPALLAPCELPEPIRLANPLYADFTDAHRAEPWDVLLRACDASLGTAAPGWLAARDEARRLLGRNQSVNLVVSSSSVQWRGLIEHLHADCLPDLENIDLQRPVTASRRGLVSEILQACGSPADVPPEPEDLVLLDRVLSARRMSRLALLHFDLAQYRDGYGIDLFAALRYFLMDSRKLVLLVQSRTPFAALLPRENPLSAIDIKTVELRG